MTDGPPDTTEALMLLGQVHLDHGRERDAFICFRDAARGGRPAAMNMLGRCYEMAWGIQRDAAMAFNCFRIAADGGDAWAMFNLADLLYRGDGCEKDFSRAYHLYEQAARGGVAKALNMLGLLIEEGVVVGQGRSTARSLFEAAAKGGDCWGAFNLARCEVAAGDIEQGKLWLLEARRTASPDFLRMIEGVSATPRS